MITPNGKYLYTIISAEGGPAGEYFYSYAIDAQSGSLTPLPPGPPINPVFTEQRNLAIDPTGRFLYETVENPPGPAGVAGFLLNPVNGDIEATVPGSPVPITDGFPVGIVIDHSGHFLYTPDSAANVLSGFFLNRTTGSLSPIPGVSPQVFSPQGIATVAPSPDSTATLTALEIEPANPSLLTGHTSFEQFTAAGTYSDGSHRFLTASVQWSSGNFSVATMSNTPGQSGLATIVSIGSTVVEAMLNGLVAKTTLTVVPAMLTSIAITPAAPAVLAGTAIQLAATGTYSDGTAKDITNAVTWKSTNVSIAVVNQSG